MTVSAPPEPILPPRRRPWGILVLVAVVLMVIGYLAFSSVGNALVYYLTPTELLARGEAAVGETVRLGGLVEAGSVAGPATDLTSSSPMARAGSRFTRRWLRPARSARGAARWSRAPAGRWRVRGNPGDRQARRELRGPGVRRAALGSCLRARGGAVIALAGLGAVAGISQGGCGRRECRGEPRLFVRETPLRAVSGYVAAQQSAGITPKEAGRARSPR